MTDNIEKPVATDTPPHDTIPAEELNPRVRAMQEIVDATSGLHDQDNKTYAETVQEVNEDGSPVAVPAVEAAPEPAPVAEDDGQAAPAPAAAAPAAFDPAQEYDVVVDGHTIKVPGAKIIEMGKRTLQKEAAADLRLQLAERILREAEAKAHAAGVVPGAPPQPPAAPQPEAPKGPTPQQLAEAIQYGTKEEAAAAIEQLSKQQGAPVTPEQVLGFVQRNIGKLVSGELEFQEAARFVQNEYKDVMAHPYLKQLFYMEENKRRAAGDNSSYKDLYKSIGDDLRKAFNLQPAANPAAPAPTNLAERKAEKVATTAPVPRTTAARLDAPAAPKAPSVSQVVDAMRKARHQRPLM